jgi:hypothetical protein
MPTRCRHGGLEGRSTGYLAQQIWLEIREACVTGRAK